LTRRVEQGTHLYRIKSTGAKLTHKAVKLD